MESCLMLLVLREMQIRVTVRYQITLTRMNATKKMITSVDKKVEKLKPLYLASGIVILCGHFGKCFGNSSKC
jgi:hypothetical protein